MNERSLRASWFITAMLFAVTLPSMADAASKEGVGSPSDSRDPEDAPPAASAPRKFINTFVIRIGGQSLKPDDGPLLAKFHMVMCDRSHYDDINGNTWRTLKAINPEIEIYPYISASSIISVNGRGRNKGSRGPSMGNLNRDHPEFFLRDKNGKRVRRRHWSVDFGSSDVQKYTFEVLKSAMLEQPWATDGVWFDHCTSIEVASVEGFRDVAA